MKRRSLPAMLAAALAAAAVLAALGVSARAFLHERPRLRANLDATHIELGEALRLARHPASVNPSYRLPWAAMLEADAYLRLSARALESWTAGLWLLALGLVFALGRELGGTGAGAVAMAVWALIFAALPRGPGFHKQFWLTALGLLAAVFWVRRARKNTDASSLLAGAGLGLTLLTRGTYVFLPLLTAAWERGRRAGLLAGAALAFLIPWTTMNALSKGRFIPIEDGSMNMNVVTGALGTVFCAHGDYAALMGEGAGGQGLGSPLPWAAKTVAASPLRYLRGVAGRLKRALTLEPLLFLFAALALLARRRDPGVLALGAMAAYFLLVNCAMSIEDDYFQPLWPLLAALAAAPVALLPEPAPRAGTMLARVVLAVSLGFSGIMTLRLLVATARYGALAARRPPSSEAALDAALAREPGAPWLAIDDARRRLAAGDAAGAVAVLHAATPLEGLPRREVLLAWALAKSGRPGVLLDMTPHAAQGDHESETLAVYQALALSGPDALVAMRRAADEWVDRQGFLNPGRAPMADALTPALGDAALGGFLVRLDQILEGHPPEDLDRALELAARARDDRAAWRELFERRLARGEKAAAARALRERQRLARGREERRVAAFDWERLGRPDLAAEAFAAVLRDEGKDAVTWSDHGVALYRAGRKAAAEKALRRALALDPGFEPARKSLDVITGEKTSRARRYLAD